MIETATASMPDNNRRIASLLFAIEVALRELIIETLSELEGKNWPKVCLPNDLQTKYMTGLDEERKKSWVEYIPHHPVYYFDFPDYVKIIENTANWRKAFEGCFKNKDVLVGSLRSLEPIRNKVAHNRMTTASDLKIVEATVAELAAAIGARRFEQLANRFSTVVDLFSSISALNREAQEVYRAMMSGDEAPTLAQWNSVNNEWWFSSEYLRSDPEPVIDFFRLANEYASLKRGRGTGHDILRWVHSHGVEEQYRTAEDILRRFIQGR